MMNRQRLVLFEITTIVLICLCVVFMFFNIHWIIKNSGKSVLDINETNRKIVEDMLKESKYYNEINNYSEVNKIIKNKKNRNGNFNNHNNINESNININTNNKSFVSENKIQYWLDFNDYQFTLYYNNGTEKQIYDDGLDNLREYIQKKGIDKGGLQLKYGLGVLFLTLFLNSIRKNISNKIEYMDKQKEK